MSNTDQPHLHLSFNPDLPKTLKPRQPDGTTDLKEKTKSKSTFYEDLPDRVSFAPSVINAWLAIYPNVSKFFEENGYPYLYMYLYEGKPDKKTKYLSPDYLKDNLWDYHLTKELVVLSPIVIIKVAKIKIYNPFDSKGKLPKEKEVLVKPYGNKVRKEIFVGPLVRIEVVEKYTSDFKYKIEQS